jgi:hypothetical protein
MNKNNKTYRIQGLTLMFIFLVLFVNLVERQVLINKQKQNIVSQDYEICLSAICLGSDTDDVSECLSLIVPTLSNVSVVSDRYSRGKNVKRIIVKPLSECQ